MKTSRIFLSKKIPYSGNFFLLIRDKKIQNFFINFHLIFPWMTTDRSPFKSEQISYTISFVNIFFSFDFI